MSTNNCATYTPLGVHTNDQPSESYGWTVPNSPSTQCRIRISLQIGGVNVEDASSSTFTIGSSGNTPTGSNVGVNLGNGADIKFDNVSGAGNTTLNVTQTGSPPPNGFLIFPTGAPKYYNIETTATVTGVIEICIKYDDSSLTPIEESKLRFYVYETPPGKWKDITSSLDTQNNIICGQVSHLSEFAMMLGPGHFNFVFNTGDSYSLVVDNATLDGNQLTNGDEIGVFTPAGLCVGASVWDGNTPLALTAWADDSQTQEKDGFVNGEKMNFRIWDADSGSETDYSAVATYATGNGNFGDGAFARISQLNAATSITQSRSLQQGWSWISLNVQPTELSMDSVMAGLSNLEIAVDGAGDFYVPNLINRIGDYNNLDAYKIYLNAPDQLSVTGTPVSAATPIPLSTGWNFVSYLPASAMDAASALASVLSELAIAKDGAGDFFVPNVINFMGNMSPGEGYKLYTNSNATLIYPQGSSTAKLHFGTPGFENSNLRHFTFKKLTGESYSVVVRSLQISGETPEVGDEVGVFTPNGLCVGGGVWDRSGILGISVWADDDRTKEIDGFRNGEEIQFRYWDAAAGREFSLEAMFTKGNGLFGEEAYALVDLETRQVPTTFALAQNYPNPFNAGTVISYQLPEAGKVVLKVYNLLGEEVRSLLNEEQEAGTYSIHWQGKDSGGRTVPSGVYIYRIQAAQFKAVKKAIFVK